jgi:hypothetical protein
VTYAELRARAVERARVEVAHPSQDWTGQCQKFVRTMFDVDPVPGFGSAREAWLHTDPADRHGGGRPIPGVPCYFKIGKFWHAVISTGDGNCISTDIRRRGLPDEVALYAIVRAWGAQYLGWTETICGRRIVNAAD